MPIILSLILYLFSSLFNPLSSVLAATTTDTDSVPVSVSVPDSQPPTPPTLISPKNTALLTQQPTFIFKRSSDTSSLTYNLLINNTPKTQNIPDSQNSLTTTYQSNVLDNNQISLSLLDSLKDGTYSWKIQAEDTASNTSSSTTFTFTLDTSPPPIILEKINQKTLNFSSQTLEPGTTVSFTTKKLTFSGQTEPSATVQLNFCLKEKPSSCQILKTQANQNGAWKKTTQLTQKTYIVNLIAIDQAGNTSTLPRFTLELTPKKPLTIPPLPSLNATIAQIKQEPPNIYAALVLLLFLLIVFLTFIYQKKPNLLLIQAKTLKPIKKAAIFHSNPQQTKPSGFFSSLKNKPRQISYWLSDNNLQSITSLATHQTLKPKDKGYIFIPNLAKYSTLTITTPSKTILLSLLTSPSKNHPITLKL